MEISMENIAVCWHCKYTMIHEPNQLHFIHKLRIVRKTWDSERRNHEDPEFVVEFVVVVVAFVCRKWQIPRQRKMAHEQERIAHRLSRLQCLPKSVSQSPHTHSPFTYTHTLMQHTFSDCQPITGNICGRKVVKMWKIFFGKQFWRRMDVCVCMCGAISFSPTPKWPYQRLRQWQTYRYHTKYSRSLAHFSLPRNDQIHRNHPTALFLSHFFLHTSTRSVCILLISMRMEKSQRFSIPNGN